MVVLGLPILVSAGNATQELNTSGICNLLSRSERGKHVGQTITFSGDFGSDIERAVAGPDGCPWAFGIGNISPQAEKGIDTFQGHHGAWDHYWNFDAGPAEWL